MFFHTSEHDRDSPQRSVSVVVSLPEASNDSLALIKAAMLVIGKPFRPSACAPPATARGKLMPRNAPRDVPMLSETDERALQAEITRDDDAPELTDAQLAQMRPARDVLPPGLFKALTKRGRPRSENKRVQVTLRIDPAVVDAYKAGGPGWQTRMNAALARGVGKEEAA